MQNETYVGLHMFIGLALMQMVALLIDKSVPYYPIEISRIAASGYYSLLIFKTTILSLGPMLLFLGETRYWLYSAWVSMVLIALFDDANYWIVHMLGVYCMVGILGVTAYYEHRNLFIFGVAMIIYVSRAVLRAIAVLVFERLDSYKDTLFQIQPIMYKGAAACSNPEYTLLFFQLSGILQWVCFWTLFQMNFENA